MTRMHSAITLKAAMDVNARKDSRVMDITTVQVINMISKCVKQLPLYYNSVIIIVWLLLYVCAIYYTIPSIVYSSKFLYT